MTVLSCDNLPRNGATLERLTAEVDLATAMVASAAGDAERGIEAASAPRSCIMCPSIRGVPGAAIRGGSHSC